MTTKSDTQPVAEATKGSVEHVKTPDSAPKTAEKHTKTADSGTKTADSAPKTADSDAKATATANVASPATEKALELAKEVVATAEATSPAPAGKTTTIKVLRSHPKLGAWPGEETTIDAELAAELIAGGFAEKATKAAK